MAERQGGGEGGFDWKKSKVVKGAFWVAVGILGIGFVSAALA